MKIPSHQLEAFFAVANTRSFSRAADTVFVTQSALSQRIAGLESELETTLFVREKSGITLTNAGEVLLRYCQTHKALESDLLEVLKSKTNELSGSIRIAGFSSVLRSVIVPSLSEFLRQNPKVNCEFNSYEVVDLPRVLYSAKADLMVTDFEMKKTAVKEVNLGFEEYVVIRSKRYSDRSDVFWDHGPHDNATESFFAAQSKSSFEYRRAFMGDVYGIIDAVKHGLGRAVMSKHLVVNSLKKDIEIVRGFKKYQRPIQLCYYEQKFYSVLQSAVQNELVKNARQYLSAANP
jgi:DNA-binding transcriptional LysR family regulator